MAIVVGTDERFKHRATCHKCASIVEYTKGEVRNLWNGKDYSGIPKGAEGFNCPNCNHEIIVKSW